MSRQASSTDPFAGRHAMRDPLLSGPMMTALGRLLRTEIRADQLLRELVDVFATTLDADRGTVYLLDEAAGELVSVAAHLPELDEIRVPLGQGVAGYVGRTGQVVNVPLCEADRRFSRRVDEETGYTTRTMLACPMRSADGRIVGVVQLLNKRGGIFSQDDQRRLQALTAQAAALLGETTLLRQLRRAAAPRPGGALAECFNGIIGRGDAMRRVFGAVRRVAETEASVLLRGESGTGKGLVARAIHVNSSRRDGPFVPLDCTTLPEGLMENELFGHEKGAFTGADRQAVGRVEAAQGGTLFLDEIGDLPLHLQGKLLTLLQDRRFTRVGGATPREVDLRIVAATNRDLEALVRQGSFREDLYYRLRVVEVDLPPLRERGREDLRALIDHFVARAARRHGRVIDGIREDALRMLLTHPWPGNVRELENCLESAVIFAEGEITPSTLSLPAADATRRVRSLAALGEVEGKAGGHTSAASPSAFEGEPTLEELEARYIAHLLGVYEGNRSQCARVLGIGRNTLLRKIRDHGLE